MIETTHIDSLIFGESLCKHTDIFVKKTYLEEWNIDFGMEAPGIEPGSEKETRKASTCLVYHFVSQGIYR